MIELSPHTAIMIYLSIALIGVLGVWLFGGKKKLTPPSESTIQTCEYCQATFISKTHEHVSKCPVCKSFSCRENR